MHVGVKLMVKCLVGVALTAVVIYLVDFVVYGAFHALGRVKVPEGVSPLQLHLSFIISTTGTAIGFGLLFYFARMSFGDHWLLCGSIWFVMSASHEIGQAMGPHYTAQEAIAGIIAEAVYCPASAFSIHWLLRTPAQ